jgi:hypothetical protein
MKIYTHRPWHLKNKTACLHLLKVRCGSVYLPFSPREQEDRLYTDMFVQWTGQTPVLQQNKKPLEQLILDC